VDAPLSPSSAPAPPPALPLSMGPPLSPPPSPATPPAPGVDAPLGTATTAASMPITPAASDRPVLPVRLIHELATRNLHQLTDHDVPPPRADDAAPVDTIRSTATIPRDSLLKQPDASATNRAITSPSLSVALPPEHATDEVTANAMAPRRGPLVWLGVAAAAASLTVLIGLIVRHFLH